MRGPDRHATRFLLVVLLSIGVGGVIAAGQNIVLDPDGSPAASIPGDLDLGGSLNMNGNPVTDQPHPSPDSGESLTTGYYRPFGWGNNSADDSMGLYHMAVEIPGANRISTNQNQMSLCAVTTDDNEPGQFGGAADSYQGNFMIGHSYDSNGHCMRNVGDWSGSGSCVSILVAGWDPASHEGFGAWCRDGSGGVVAAKIDLAGGGYWSSSGGFNGSISEPALGDYDCSQNGKGCVKRIR